MISANDNLYPIINIREAKWLLSSYEEYVEKKDCQNKIF